MIAVHSRILASSESIRTSHFTYFTYLRDDTHRRSPAITPMKTWPSRRERNQLKIGSREHGRCRQVRGGAELSAAARWRDRHGTAHASAIHRRLTHGVVLQRSHRPRPPRTCLQRPCSLDPIFNWFLSRREGHVFIGVMAGLRR